MADYMVQEELKRRISKMSSGTRFNSRHPLSGLLVCGQCGSRYIRASQYEKRTETYNPIWRCSEKVKSGTKKCKAVPNLKEDKLYGKIMDQMQIILDSEISSSSAPLLQTKALIANHIGENKVVDSAMTQEMTLC